MAGTGGATTIRGRAGVAAATLALATLAGPPAAALDLPVDLELVLAVDVSGSMDRDEHRLQRDGYIAAVRHPEVLAAIRAGPMGRIAVTYVEWAGPGAQVIAVPWRALEDDTSAESFAKELEVVPIAAIRGTSISGSLTFTSGLFDGNGFEGLRRVVDVSGDGPNNSGAPVEPARDRLLEDGIVINGLPIMLKRPSYGWSSISDLDLYYEDCVIGGPGSFVIPVRAPEHFAQAIRRKMILEIAGVQPPAARVVPASLPERPKMDCLIGERMRRIWVDP